VFDNKNKRLKAVLLWASGTLDQNTAALSSGMYHYSLVVDGKIVESRKMEVIRQ
jgi:hypothetical protein